MRRSTTRETRESNWSLQNLSIKVPCPDEKNFEFYLDIAYPHLNYLLLSSNLLNLPPHHRNHTTFRVSSFTPTLATKSIWLQQCSRKHFNPSQLPSSPSYRRNDPSSRNIEPLYSFRPRASQIRRSDSLCLWKVSRNVSPSKSHPGSAETVELLHVELSTAAPVTQNWRFYSRISSASLTKPNTILPSLPSFCRIGKIHL